MATLVRTRRDESLGDIRDNVPTPFPVQELIALQNESLADSVAAVQHSCLMTLANILLPLPAHDAHDAHDSECIPFSQVLAESPLSSLVHALRDRRDPAPGDAALLSRLREHLDAVAPALDCHDAHLAYTILDLLLDLDQLPASLALSAPLPHPGPVQHDVPDGGTYATIASLQRHLSSLQPSSSAPIESVRNALLWARIDEQLDTVVSLCRARAPRPSLDEPLPPEYDHGDRPPSYIAGGYLDDDDDDDDKYQYPPEKVLSRPSTSAPPEETEPPHSTALELDSITHAIDRLYLVAPQLANQRVELRREKIAQMEQAKQGKGKARTFADDPELDRMLDLLGRASSREIPDQSVVMDPRREKGTADIEEQRSKYLEHLVHRTHAGRLHSQDAIPSLNRSYSSPSTADDENAEKSSRDGKRASFPAAPKSSSSLAPPSEKSRNRSLSAPHLAWLRPRSAASSAKQSTTPSPGPKSVRNLSGILRGPTNKSRPCSSGAEGVNHGALDVAYVAEHHETLKHVLLFISPASPFDSTSGTVPVAEVLPSTSSGTHGDCLFLRLGDTPSPPLALPVPVVPGSKTVLCRSGHWEVKASSFQSAASKESEDVALLPASELASLSPSSYTCSSCSLPLVSVPPGRYRDLPSEHWEELIDAWMCHPEGQTLAKTGLNGKGSGLEFWPTRDEALVGGSYVLFDGAAVVGGNIKCVANRERGVNTRLARCLCGAILGRQHERKLEDGTASRMYRLFKYAIRPTSATSHVPKIPMSAFVLYDMLEHIQAHATYRFVLSDEEDERPRLLIWLFKPRIRISYMLAMPALLPKNGTINASKVLYKILGPTSSSSDFKEILNTYPGFPQAEYMFYPMDVCRKLAALLKESTTSYPESMQTMTGLDVGWLTMTP